MEKDRPLICHFPTVRSFQNCWKVSLNLQELSRLLLAPHMTLPVSTTFECYPTTTATLRHYAFLSKSIVTLEEELERHQVEREDIYDHMMQNGVFRRKIQPIIVNYRQTAPRRTRFRSYNYNSPSPSPSPSPESYPSSLNGNIEFESSQSITILPEEALARNSTPSVTPSPINSTN
jgi:hypothetical protein